jgi:hypothetical protein
MLKLNALAPSGNCSAVPVDTTDLTPPSGK